MSNDPIASIFDPRYVKAVSHPLRVRVLALLEERTASPRELSELLATSLGTVSYHVRRLHQVGLLELVRTTRVRGAVAHHYRAKLPPKASAQAWSSGSPVAKQAEVAAALQMINDHASASAAAGGFDHSSARFVRTRARLDDRGWRELASACELLVAELERIEQDAAARLQQNGAVATEAALSVLLFESADLAAGPPEPLSDSAAPQLAGTTH